jgi:hypothetical protein
MITLDGLSKTKIVNSVLLAFIVQSIIIVANLSDQIVWQ